MSQEQENKVSKPSRKVLWIVLGCILLAGIGVGAAALLGLFGGKKANSVNYDEVARVAASWPEAFEAEVYNEPAFEDDENRTNNAFNVKDFGEQGKNGWFYRYGNAKKPERSKRVERFDGATYSQMGANGLEIKSNFLHTSEAASPILEWRAAQDGRVNILLTYVKNVNGDANPGYPDGVQLLIYKNGELLKLENVDISTTEELLTQIRIDDLEVKKGDSLYFVVSARSNNAYDGGSLYIDIRDVNAPEINTEPEAGRKDNNANNQADFGAQGKNGWLYLVGTDPQTAKPASHEAEDGSYIDSGSPNLTMSQGFIHPALNNDAVLAWVPAVDGDVDLRVKYSKFEQHDGNPDFPDGVIVRVYKNGELLFEEHVDAPAKGENVVSFRSPKLAVTTKDRLYFTVGAEGNASYDGGAFDITVIDINGAKTEKDVAVETTGTRQNIADAAIDFGPQGSNGWFFQSGYADEPFDAYNMEDFDQKEDRYFHESWLEIKRDYVNPGEHGRSAVIKWEVAQNGTVSIRAAYTKTKNEDANPDWPDGTRVSLYHNGKLLKQETFEPNTVEEITKRLDVESLEVAQGDYITLVINGLNNIAYDGGKYEFAIGTLSGLAGRTEKDVAATPASRTNFASTKDDFGKQGTNGWYYQFGYGTDPFTAVNIENYKEGERYLSDENVEIKKDFIVPAGNKSALVKWVVAQNGRINIDLEYTKLKNEDANPSWPDGVTVYLFHNSKVLKQLSFQPYTDREVTGSLSVNALSVKAGDVITMLVDPGKNPAYDAGKYMFVIEDTDKIPAVAAGNWDNNTSLKGLGSVKQGTDGWFFLEGRSIGDVRVLTKMTADGLGWLSRRTDGLEMKDGYVHTGESWDPIYQWVAGQSGRIDISGEYMKFGHQDPNPNWPDGVVVKIWHNGTLLKNTKVQVRKGDGNNNTISFSFDGLAVARGDKLSFQISAGANNAWDGGQISVVIEAASNVKRTPGDDNNTNLGALASLKQGEDGWWFLEGTTLANAKLLTAMNADGTAFISQKTEGLEMKKDYVHPGASQDAIYQWIAAAAQNGLKVEGSYVKFGHQDSNPSWPDGVTLKIWHGSTLLLEKKVKALQGDGNDNTVNFSFPNLNVKAGDAISFQISAGGNSAWDAGRLSVLIGNGTVPQPDIDQVEPDPNRTNNTSIPGSFNAKQGYDGWYYGMCDWDSKNFVMLAYDAANERYYNNGKPELKKDFVEPGNGRNAAYKWIVAKDGTVYVKGEYVKFANSSDAKADGTCVRIFVNGVEKKWLGTIGNFAADQTVSFNETFEVKAGDEIVFAINPEGNDSWDGGKFSVTISDTAEEPGTEPEAEPEPTPADRDNNTVLADDFSGTQGWEGWYYGACDWNSENFALVAYDEANARYFEGGKPELKKDYVEPGSRNAAYKWVVAEDGTVKVDLEYVKFANNADPDANGTSVRVFLNGAEKKWLGAEGNFAEEKKVTFAETFEVKAGDVFIFAVDANGNDSYDGGRLSVAITAVDEPAPGNVEKTELETAVAEAQALNEADYTEESWAALQTALADAENVLADNDATQDEVDAAKEALEAAVAALIPRPTPEDRDNNTVLADDFSGTQGWEGWYYGRCDWNSTEFKLLSYDEENERYYNGGKPELKKDFVEPGGGWNAAYKWVVAADGRINVKGEYVKFANNEDPDANGVCVRIFLNGEEKKWMGGEGSIQGNFSEERKVEFDEKYDVHAGDEILFAINPEGNDSYDGGRLSVAITAVDEPAPGNVEKTELETAVAEAQALNEADYTEESWAALQTALADAENVLADNDATQDEVDAAKEALEAAVAALIPRPTPEDRDNNTVLADDFSGTQGWEGWYYGRCDWNSTEFKLLSYDEENERYYNGGKPELKKDFVEPGGGWNAAYKWVVAADGRINVKGEYVKFANNEDPDANGVCVRIFLNGEEKKWMGGEGSIQGNFSEERKVEFDEKYDVHAGDEILFAINPEGNDSYDGGRLSVAITAVDEPAEPPQKYTVSYVYEGTYPEAVMATLPSDGAEYEDGAEVTAIQPNPAEIAGEQDGVSGTWKFDGWDANTKTVNGANVTFTGTWTFTAGPAEPTQKYTVSYVYEGTYPEAVMATLPSDGAEYEDGAEVTAIQPNPAEIAGEQDGVSGTWKFDGWDANTKTVNGANVTFTGTWTFTPDPVEPTKYTVSYAYDGTYPDAVMATLPAAEEHTDGTTVTPAAPSSTSVAGTDGGNRGVWEFQGWDKDSETVNGANIVFTGTWTFRRTNNAVLKDDFSAVQGTNGWYYGAADWNGASFEELPYANGAYLADGKAEVKADFAEPRGRNAAYKWVVAEAGKIRIEGEYVKFANSADPNANGVCFRVKLYRGGNPVDGMEQFIGVKGNFTEDQVKPFDLPWDVLAGDEVFFLIDPEEGNTSYDGGRVTAAITPAG